jgi:alcohol dehydrogenase
MCVDAGLKVWARSQEIIRGSRKAETADLLNMMRASMMAGMAIAHTATTLPHGLSYPVTIRLRVPHGKATAYFTAGYLTEASAADREYILSTAGFASIDDFRAVFHEACGEINEEEEKIREVLNDAVEELGSNPVKLGLAPFNPDKEMLRRIAFYELDHAL